jgi:hypothetical protein
MHDAADDSAIVRPLDAPDIRRQVRFDPLPLLIAQPKQVVAHDPNPLPKTNQDRIVRAEKLMSSDPSSPARTPASSTVRPYPTRACKLGLEGIVSKRLGSPYRSGRSRHWVKSKNPAAPAVKREAEEDWGKERW